jgi:flagellar basal-body rod protein FlgC
MNYFTAMDISATGLNAERLRLDITALNIANANTPGTATGEVYQPLRMITAPRINADFTSYLNKEINKLPYKGVDIVDVIPVSSEPRLVFEPEHPNANPEGFVSYPSVNMVSEMLNLVVARRSYEANIRAMSAAKSMAESALQIGNNR